MNLKQRLERPFPVSSIHWRIGATSGDKATGIGLAYIDARDVKRRLDDAVGEFNWQCSYPHAGRVIVCRLGIRVNDEWIWRENGAGETDVEGEKGGCSDAFKRSAVMFGIGAYLYALPAIWVPIIQRGKSYALPDDSIKQLQKRLPEWATPEGYDKLIAQREENHE